MKKYFLLLLLCFICATGFPRDKFDFNRGWLLHVGDVPSAAHTSFNDKGWKPVTLPHAFNEDEAFAVDIKDLTDTVMWYRKHFVLPPSIKGGKVFLEFEGARQGVEVYVNGRLAGRHDNGVMAFGLDITPFAKSGRNVVAVRVDNTWEYFAEGADKKYQWSDRNFNANYGGLPKNVRLHVTGPVYQTLPLYSNLGTTGTYIYATDIRTGSRKAEIHAESQVRNEGKKPVSAGFEVCITDPEGRVMSTFSGEEEEILPGSDAILKASAEVEGLEFWSWGYGYLYDVKTSVTVDGKSVDEVTTRTGFRKTRFSEGKFSLNDRVTMVHGFAQRTSNEWPALGMSVPAWLSDYSNRLMVECGGNLVRWMHVTPWKQDIESCDRVGLMQAMPAGDAEKDVQGIQWEQRKALMRDAIIYNRNNPSIIFYECGNESISREHMLEMREIRDKYDFYGGRAIGSREMLDIREAEYGGEMLYINKSAHSPFWAMEYCRDEGLRLYWDGWSWPYHKEGDGNKGFLSASTGKIVPGNAAPYNHNQDELAIEHIRRWYDYRLERPGTGTRVSSGGVNIIFSDSNTHYRGVENYRRSGVVDPMRIPKDTWFAHLVMWDGWVRPEMPHIYIIGHWNYPEGTVKPVYVVSNTQSVKLFLNGKELPCSSREYDYLFTFDNVEFQPGTLTAVGYDGDRETARCSKRTAGAPASLKLTPACSPSGWMADGADVTLLQIEVVDSEGIRCPLANNMIHWELEGPAEWRGGLAKGPRDNYVLAKDFPVECGVNRALLRSTTTPGNVTVTASAEGLGSASISLGTLPCKAEGGLSTYIPGDFLPLNLTRGATPEGPSYTDEWVDAPIVDAEAGSNNDTAANSFDDNELSEWCSDGTLAGGWITYTLGRMAQVDEVCMKLTGWRLRSYPIEIYAGDEPIWEGETPKSLGYVHIPVKSTMTREITVRVKGSASEGDAFSGIVEVAAPVAGELDLYHSKDADKTNNELRIVEIEFKEKIHKK